MARVMTLSKLSLSKRSSNNMKRRVASQSSGSEAGTDANYDIESQAKNESPKINGRLLASSRSSSSSPANGNRGPSINTDTPTSNVPIRVLLRKIAMAVMTDLDDETLLREDTETILIVITLLKEAMMGIIIAFVMVSAVLFIDHHFVLRFHTARNFRKATFAVMNDRVTLRNFEENAGLKFVDMDEYEGMLGEIAKAGNKTKLAKSILHTRGEDLIGISAELAEIKPKVESYRAYLGLEKFCETCLWGGRMSCEERVEWLVKNEVPRYQSMMAVMHKTTCVKSEDQLREEKRMNDMVAEVNKIVNEWDIYEGEFNSDGLWRSGTICSARADYLSGRFGYPLNKAKAMTMVETNQCRNSFNVEEGIEENDGLCKECPYSKKMTCGQRVNYLKTKYQQDVRTAKSRVMENAACVIRSRRHRGDF